MPPSQVQCLWHDHLDRDCASGYDCIHVYTHTHTHTHRSPLFYPLSLSSAHSEIHGEQNTLLIDGIFFEIWFCIYSHCIILYILYTIFRKRSLVNAHKVTITELALHILHSVHEGLLSWVWQCACIVTMFVDYQYWVCSVLMRKCTSFSTPWWDACLTLGRKKTGVGLERERTTRITKYYRDGHHRTCMGLWWTEFFMFSSSSQHSWRVHYGYNYV